MGELPSLLRQDTATDYRSWRPYNLRTTLGVLESTVWGGQNEATCLDCAILLEPSIGLIAGDIIIRIIVSRMECGVSNAENI
jgi:hypothetical protein